MSSNALMKSLGPSNCFLLSAAAAGAICGGLLEASAGTLSLQGPILGLVVVAGYGAAGCAAGSVLRGDSGDRLVERLQKGLLALLALAFLVMFPICTQYAVVGNAAGPFVREVNATAGVASLVVGVVFGLACGLGAVARGVIHGSLVGAAGWALTGNFPLPYVLSGVLVGLALSAVVVCRLPRAEGDWAWAVVSSVLLGLIGLVPGPFLSVILDSVCHPASIHMVGGALIGAGVYMAGNRAGLGDE